MPARDVDLERQWRERIERLAESGLSAVKFAEREGVPVHQVTWWRRELWRRDSVSHNDAAPSPTQTVKKKRAQTKQPKPSTKFVPVSVTPSKATTAAIEIVLDRPLRIAVSPGFDGDLLRQVMGVLENGSC